MVGGVADLNEQLAEIANLNRAIDAGGGAMSIGDLADKRDLAIRNIAEVAGVTAHLQADGQATVFLGGHAVVNGGEARQLSVDTSGAGIPIVTLAVDGGSINANKLLGGKVGGEIAAYEATSGYLDELDTFAADFTNAMNAQHAAGFDANGTAGGALFSFDPTNAATTMSFSAAITADPDLLAFASSPTALAGDGGNLAAMMTLEGQSIVGGKTPGTFLSNLTSEVGGDVSSAAIVADRQSDIIFDLDELASNLGGVDMDEEASNLMMYQTAYQAAAKTMQVTDQMLGVLMDVI